MCPQLTGAGREIETPVDTDSVLCDLLRMRQQPRPREQSSNANAWFLLLVPDGAVSVDHTRRPKPYTAPREVQLCPTPNESYRVRWARHDTTHGLTDTAKPFARRTSLARSAAMRMHIIGATVILSLCGVPLQAAAQSVCVKPWGFRTSGSTTMM